MINRLIGPVLEAFCIILLVLYSKAYTYFKVNACMKKKGNGYFAVKCISPLRLFCHELLVMGQS